MNQVETALIWLMNQVGYAICHQMPERALSFGGKALPVCARDTGLYLGFTACFLVLLLAYGGGSFRYPTLAKTVVIVLFLAPALIDAVTSYAGWRESSNAVRLMTGSFAGTGLAALVFPTAAGFLSFRGSSHGQGSSQGQGVVFETLRSVALLALVPAGICLLLIPELPGAYWIWAPLLTASVLLTFAVLAFTAIALVTERLRGSLAAPRARQATAVVAVFTTVVLITASNRLHWLMRGPS